MYELYHVKQRVWGSLTVTNRSEALLASCHCYSVSVVVASDRGSRGLLIKKTREPFQGGAVVLSGTSITKTDWRSEKKVLSEQLEKGRFYIV
mmetsp:Transcript_73123/g.128834  ORF Transcript_73123/g.128834 Transcript_73123/m.128834 type:complete len:92 (+) Transcript_73123:3-278(+)